MPSATAITRCYIAIRVIVGTELDVNIAITGSPCLQRKVVAGKTAKAAPLQPSVILAMTVILRMLVDNVN